MLAGTHLRWKDMVRWLVCEHPDIYRDIIAGKYRSVTTPGRWTGARSGPHASMQELLGRQVSSGAGAKFPRCGKRRLMVHVGLQMGYQLDRNACYS